MSLPRKANGPPSLLLEPRFDSIPSDPPSVLLIGCGAVGSVVAQHLCASDDVAEVILADVDGELAKRTASRLKSPKARATQLDASDGDTASSPDYPFIALFSPETFVEETLAPSRIWRDGKYDSVPPFGELEAYEFPAPIGSLPVYSVDHEEVDTLPRFIGKGVRYVDFKLALDPPTVQTLKLFRDKGKLSPENLAPKPFFALLRKFGIDVKERVRSERSLT